MIVVVYAPLAHEFMLKMQKRSEDKGKFIYVSDDIGVAVLEVAPSSPAFSVGIRTGDKILEINNKKVISEVDIFHTIKDSTVDVTIKIKKFSGEIRDYVMNYVRASRERNRLAHHPRGRSRISGRSRRVGRRGRARVLLRFRIVNRASVLERRSFSFHVFAARGLARFLERARVSRRRARAPAG